MRSGVQDAGKASHRPPAYDAALLMLKASPPLSLPELLCLQHRLSACCTHLSNISAAIANSIRPCSVQHALSCFARRPCRGDPPVQASAPRFHLTASAELVFLLCMQVSFLLSSFSVMAVTVTCISNHMLTHVVHVQTTCTERILFYT